MNLLSKMFGKSNPYDDSLLVSEATSALSTHPLISNSSSLSVTSEQGVMTLGGVVEREQDKQRAEDVVRNVIETKGLKHDQIVNELKLPHSTR